MGIFYSHADGTVQFMAAVSMDFRSRPLRLALHVTRSHYVRLHLDNCLVRISHDLHTSVYFYIIVRDSAIDNKMIAMKIYRLISFRFQVNCTSMTRKMKYCYVLKLSNLLLI